MRVLVFCFVVVVARIIKSNRETIGKRKRPCHGLPIEWKIEEQYKKNKKNKNEVPIVVIALSRRRRR